MIKILIENCTKISDSLYHLNGYDYHVDFNKKSVTCKCSLTLIFIAEVYDKEKLLNLINFLKD